MTDKEPMNPLKLIILTLFLCSCGVKVSTQNLNDNLYSTGGSGSVDTSTSTELVSSKLPSIANPASISSDNISTSADGRYIVFEARNVIGNFPVSGYSRVYLTDTISGVTELVSKTSTRLLLEYGTSFKPVISGDASTVAFITSSQNLDFSSRAIGGSYTLVIFDRISKELKSVADGIVDDSISISTNGKRVAFISSSSSLVAGDTNGRQDAFIYDGDADSIIRISESSTGVQSDRDIQSLSISGDGLYATFTSSATNLDPALTDKSGTFPQGYIHNVVAGKPLA